MYPLRPQRPSAKPSTLSNSQQWIWPRCCKSSYLYLFPFSSVFAGSISSHHIAISASWVSTWVDYENLSPDPLPNNITLALQTPFSFGHVTFLDQDLLASTNPITSIVRSRGSARHSSTTIECSTLSRPLVFSRFTSCLTAGH